MVTLFYNLTCTPSFKVLNELHSHARSIKIFLQIYYKYQYDVIDYDKK